MKNKQYIGLAIVALAASIYISACNNSTQTKEVGSSLLSMLFSAESND